MRDWLRDDLKLRDDSAVLEPGAGTGKFTTHLMATGARVIALDPVAEMLDELRRKLPNATTMLGAAESMPLADHSVDAVVCAQSFHWFATPPALAEMRRVLKPGGMLGLIWNKRDTSVDWVASITTLITPYEGDAPRYDHDEWRKLFPAQGFTPLQERCFPHHHTGSPQNVILDRVASISFIAALDADERERLLTEVRNLIDTTPTLAGRSEVTFPYVTVAYHCTRL